MKAIAQFEEFLESLVEGSFRRLFGGRLEPVDFARRLGRVMDDNKRVTWDRPLVPNQYRIQLSPADYADVQGYVESLQRELAKFATDRAAERGYSMLAPAEVRIEQDEATAAGSFQVRASLVEVSPEQAPAMARPQEDFGQTRAMRPLEMPVGPTGFELLLLRGELNGHEASWALSGNRITVGRGLDNDIVLEDASVSRHHAELAREGGKLEVRDLGSTNGTWVNAGRVTAAALQPGDQIAFGAIHLEVTRGAEPTR